MFALALTLCSFASCNTYIIETDDEWKTSKQCEVLVDKHHVELSKIWRFDYSGQTLFKDFNGMEEYLSRYGVQEDSITLDSYELECLQYVYGEE